VTHYASHYGFLEDDQLIRGASALAGIDCAIIHGRFDFAAPSRQRPGRSIAPGPRAAFTVITDAGHHSNDAMRAALVAASDRFATR
jgi:proline iminopeptidase